MRINQFIARHLDKSRRACDILIEKGMVEINGELATLGAQVSDEDNVKVFDNGKWKDISGGESEGRTVLLFYKPIFSITSKNDPQKRKTIYNFMPKKYHGLKSAGRLDYMSEGLLVLTDDGQLIDSLTHPKNDCSKEYLVGVKEKISPESLDLFKKGMIIEGYRIKPIGVDELKDESNFDYLKLDPHLMWYIFKLKEGRNNQIRKMVQVDGQKVSRLIRIKHGDYKLSKELKDNKYLEL